MSIQSGVQAVAVGGRRFSSSGWGGAEVLSPIACRCSGDDDDNGRCFCGPTTRTTRTTGSRGLQVLMIVLLHEFLVRVALFLMCSTHHFAWGEKRAMLSILAILKKKLLAFMLIFIVCPSLNPRSSFGPASKGFEASAFSCSSRFTTLQSRTHTRE